MPRILIVENDEQVSLLLRYNLEAAGYEVVVSGTASAILPPGETRPDLILLDDAASSHPVVQFRWPVREGSRERPPVILLASRETDAERWRRTRGAVDDFIEKPFSFPDLLTHIRSALYRTNGSPAAPLTFADITLDRDALRVTRSGRPVHLGPTEFKLLEMLLQAPGRVFTREQILWGVWDGGADVGERTVDVHIGRLRKALTASGRRDPIRTVRGSGYALNDEIGAVRRRRAP